MIRSGRLLAIHATVILLAFSLFFTFAAASEIAYQEFASEVMMERFAVEEDEPFLKELYTQLHFVPAWTTEKAVSALAQALFKKIRGDRTLDAASALKQESLQLQTKAETLYGSGATLKEKIDLEFEISKLYRRYVEYVLYESINWGAFDAQLHNLKAEGIHAGWVPYKPQADPVTLLQEAILEGSLEETLEGAEPKSYHYSALKEKLIEHLEVRENGEWEAIPYTHAVKLGKSDISLSLIRERLRFFAQSDPNVDYEKALKRLEESRNEHLKLQQQIPVDIVYIATFVDYNGCCSLGRISTSMTGCSVKRCGRGKDADGI